MRYEKACSTPTRKPSPNYNLHHIEHIYPEASPINVALDRHYVGLMSFPFSFLDKIESAYEAIQSAFVVAPDEVDSATFERAWFSADVNQRPPSPLGIADDYDRSSSEETDASGSTLVVLEPTAISTSAHELATKYRLHYTPPTPIFCGKILPDIAKFDEEHNTEQAEADEDTSDNDSFYSSESSEALAKALRLSVQLPTDPPVPFIGSDGQQYYTTLPTPPLPRGVTRSNVVFVPEDAPGVCPVHGCDGEPCAICESQPIIFSF